MALFDDTINARTGEELAAAFGWSAEQITQKVIEAEAEQITVETASIEGEGAVLFSKLATPASSKTLDKISLYGYHASCPWGIVSDPSGTHILSSRWLRNQEWYRLSPIPNNILSHRAALLHKSCEGFIL
ncbi:hypothetical protein ACDP63_25025 [Paracoccus sp. P2]|uniref:hypothetical protein n=1 Tax=Paracoccus sp. P2 TaxID=3248840 RepID=UPI00391F88C3